MESSPYFVIPKKHNLDVQQFICYIIVISSYAFGLGIMGKHMRPFHE
jgi:malate synthase